MVRFMRWILVLIFVAWAVFASYHSRNLQALSEPEQFFNKNHEISVLRNMLNADFQTSSMHDIQVSIYFGVKDLNLKSVDRWQPMTIGTPIFDEEFDIESIDAQTDLLNFCASLRKQSFVMNPESVDCWIESFLATENSNRPFTNMNDWDFNMNQWIKKVGGEKAVSKNQLGFINNKLKYFRVDAKSIGDPRATSQTLTPIYEQWEAFLENFRQTSKSKSLNSIKQNAGVNWAWIDTEQGFMHSAKDGVICAGIVAFVVLLAASTNLIIAFSAILCVGIVVVSVICLLIQLNWQLGVSESICLVILIGLSVDYCVHLAMNYMHEPYILRGRKMQETFRNMGSAIFSAALTTLGAGCFLYGGKLITFHKFAIIICATIGASFLVSMLFFGAIMHICGPQSGCGNLFYSCEEREDNIEETGYLYD